MTHPDTAERGPALPRRAKPLARRGMLASAVLLACALAGVAGFGWWQVRGARTQLAGAQAVQLTDALLRCARAQPLDACAEGRPELRWVRLDDAPTYGAQTWGVDTAPGVEAEPGAVRVLSNGLVRVSRPLPGRPPHGDAARASDGWLTVDFEPLFGARLEAQAQATSVLAWLVAAGLVGAALALERLLARAEQVEAEAARLEALAAMGTMSAVLAHEVRNPVAALLGNAQLLAEEHDSEQVRHIVDSASRLKALTESLLSFARTGAVRRASVDPVAPARTALGAHGTLVVDRAPRVWSLDPERVEQVLVALVSNAPGPVELTVRSEGALVYEVRDRGPGLPAGDPEQLFAPFFTTRARGTGLGLTIARRLVEAHGGTLSAANHPDGGAVFTVRIPEGPA